MADRTRSRRNPPAVEGGQGRRRVRSGDAPPDPPRRRRGGGTDNAQASPAAAAPLGQSQDRSTPVATEVTLPQLGESVTEGTITAWLVAVGDTVEADQPLFELSSDKIDTEVPAPTSGVLQEIKVQVDETVDVGTVVAVIGEGGADGASGGGATTAPDSAEDADQTESAAPAEEREEVARDAAEPQASPAAERDDAPAEPETGTYERTEAEPAAAAGRSAEQPATGDGGDGAATLASPLVRRLAAEHDVDLATLRGTGEGGRVTREDVEGAIGGGGQAAPAAPSPAPAAAQGRVQPEARPAVTPQPQRRPTPQAGPRTRVEDLSRIRQRIAAKMMESLASSAQLTTVQEADLTRAMRLRDRVKDEFKAREGVSLSPFVFLCRAAVLAIRNHPRINAYADWNAGKATFHEYVNLGIAVDTEKGLLVPNVKGADDLSLAGLARAIKEVADKARGKGKLEMSDIEGATFTMTNTGSVGVLIDTPILNYPEVAILGTGAVQPRPVVVQDDTGPAIAIRDMVYLSLTYDHRLIDGADAARFVTDVKQVVETHDWAAEIGYDG